MEIPDELKRLYRHWERHCRDDICIELEDYVDLNLFGGMLNFAKERMKIWEQKYQGKPQPWTQDPILAKYKFCNVYRELDRQTIEFHSLLTDLRSDLALWMLNMLYCRGVCKPETVKATGLLSLDNRQNQTIFKKLTNLPKPKYGTAYVFPVSILEKIWCHNREEFWCFYLPKRVKKMAEMVANSRNAEVVSLVEHLVGALGVNLRFHLTELLIDTAYQYPENINLFGKFPIGPGAEPTMRRLNQNIAPEGLVVLLSKYRLLKFPFLEFYGRKVSLSAENWEGIACEFRKYSNLKLGVGRRRIYRNSHTLEYRS